VLFTVGRVRYYSNMSSNDTIDRLAAGPVGTGRDIGRLDAAVDAMGDIDLTDWSDTALSGHLDELSSVLCRVDAQLSRLADAVRSRGFSVIEMDLKQAA